MYWFNENTWFFSFLKCLICLPFSIPTCQQTPTSPIRFCQSVLPKTIKILAHDQWSKQIEHKTKSNMHTITHTHPNNGLQCFFDASMSLSAYLSGWQNTTYILQFGYCSKIIPISLDNIECPCFSCSIFGWFFFLLLCSCLEAAFIASTKL